MVAAHHVSAAWVTHDDAAAALNTLNISPYFFWHMIPYSCIPYSTIHGRSPMKGRENGPVAGKACSQRTRVDPRLVALPCGETRPMMQVPRCSSSVQWRSWCAGRCITVCQRCTMCVVRTNHNWSGAVPHLVCVCISTCLLPMAGRWPVANTQQQSGVGMVGWIAALCSFMQLPHILWSARGYGKQLIHCCVVERYHMPCHSWNCRRYRLHFVLLPAGAQNKLGWTLASLVDS